MAAFAAIFFAYKKVDMPIYLYLCLFVIRTSYKAVMRIDIGFHTT